MIGSGTPLRTPQVSSRGISPDLKLTQVAYCAGRVFGLFKDIPPILVHNTLFVVSISGFIP